MPNTRNLRKGRVSVSGGIYSITTVSFRRQKIFLEIAKARAAIKGLRYCDDKGHSRTLAFVVMPDHVHWLFQLGDAASLSKVVNAFKGMSGSLLRKADRTPVWQRGYHDHAVRLDEDLKAVARYIVANPLRGGLVERIGDYPWWDAVWVDSPDFTLS